MIMHMYGSPIHLLIAAAVLCLGAGEEGEPQLLRPLDQGVADVTPLSESLRVRELDLQSPIGFAEVYQVPGRPDWLMRASGALYAVFPHSVYLPTEIGAMPVIPNNTVFYIGWPSLADVPMNPVSLMDDEEPRAVRYEPRLDIRLDDTLLSAEQFAVEESVPLMERPSETAETESVLQMQFTAPRGRVRTDLESSSLETGRHRTEAQRTRFGPEQAQALASGTIEGDPEYRASRVRFLLRRAARNEMKRTASGS